MPTKAKAKKVQPAKAKARKVHRAKRGASKAPLKAAVTKIDWIASVGCEGGPLLIASAKDFAVWPGALGTSREKNELQYDGYVDKVPKAFRPSGEAMTVVHASEAEARAAMGALRTAIEAKYAGVQVTQDETQLHFLFPTRAQISVELGPTSEYDASWRAHLGEQTWTHVWGLKRNYQGLFYDLEGGCSVAVGASKGRDQLWLVQSWIDDEKDESKVRAFVEAAGEIEEDSPGELQVPTGHVVVAWSPTGVMELVGFNFDKLGWDGFEAKLRALAEQRQPARLGTDMIRGLGTAMRIKAGRWTASVGRRDSVADGWSCRWCHLKWRVA